MIWAYAIVEAARAPLPRVRGLEDTPLDIVELRDAGVIVSRHAGSEPPRWSHEAMLTHEAVVEALLSSRAVMPLRFGTVMPDDGALVRALEEQAQDWPALLERVRGRVEIAVTVPAPEEETAEQPAAADGRSYLLDKVARRRAAVEIVRRLDAAVETLAEAATVRIQPDPEVAVKAAYLVRRVDAARARGLLEEAVPGAVSTGPWPPYSFTTAERLGATEGATA